MHAQVNFRGIDMRVYKPSRCTWLNSTECDGNADFYMDGWVGRCRWMSRQRGGGRKKQQQQNNVKGLLEFMNRLFCFLFCLSVDLVLVSGLGFLAQICFGVCVFPLINFAVAAVAWQLMAVVACAVVIIVLSYLLSVIFVN